MELGFSESCVQQLWYHCQPKEVMNNRLSGKGLLFPHLSLLVAGKPQLVKMLMMYSILLSRGNVSMSFLKHGKDYLNMQ